MDIQGITQIVGTLGFPIFACVALFWQNVKLSEQHKQEMESVREALNNNTLALTRLIDKMGGDYDE